MVRLVRSLLGLVGSRGEVAPPWGSVGLKGLPGAGLEGLAGVGVGEASHAVVLDVGHVAVVTVHEVSDGLQAAVGEVHGVHALGVVTVAGLLVVEVVAGGVVLYGPLEVVLGLGGLAGLEGLEGAGGG